MTALDHRKPDRPPLNYFGTPETTEKLLRHLLLDTCEDLLCYFGSDMRYVGAKYVGPKKFCGASGFSVSGRDMWGNDVLQRGHEGSPRGEQSVGTYANAKNDSLFGIACGSDPVDMVGLCALHGASAEDKRTK